MGGIAHRRDLTTVATYTRQARSAGVSANVLINLMHVTRLALCARLPGYQYGRSRPGTIRLEFYQVNASIGGAKGDIDQVPVMGEDDYLRFGRELRQRAKAGPSALVVPVDEEVIRDKRERCALLQMEFERSKPQRHVKLVLRAGAQPVDSDEGAIGVTRVEGNRLRLKIDHKFRVATQRQSRKGLTGPFEQWLLSLLAVALDRPFEEFGAYGDAHVFIDRISHEKQGILPFGFGSGGVVLPGDLVEFVLCLGAPCDACIALRFSCIARILDFG